MTILGPLKGRNFVSKKVNGIGNNDKTQIIET